MELVPDYDNLVFSDADGRYENLKAELERLLESTKDALSERKQFEADMLKIQLWMKETEISASSELKLDCSVELLADQLKRYQGIDNAANAFESLQMDVQHTGGGFENSLSDADRLRLKQQLESLSDNFDRCISLIFSMKNQFL